MEDMDSIISRLEDTDRNFIWHPFTQMQDWCREKPLIISEARGCFVRDIRGRWYLDGISSMWVNIHGHRREEINEAVKKQLDSVSHTTLLGLANVPSIELAGKLAGIAPAGMKRVFYSDNGSTAVEVALKMAFQYWKHRGEKRDLFVSFNNGYHGDTIGAMSVGGVDLFHAAFGPLFFKTIKAPSPYCYRCELGIEKTTCGMACLHRLGEILHENRSSVAAVILEPLVQAAGGMIVAPEGFLSGVRRLCTDYNVPLILDEVATGFGRTGRMFACEHEDVSPDLICLSKGLTGGYLPLAVTLCKEEIYNAFLGEFRDLKTFFHGHSYTGNQLGCAAALASLELFTKDGTMKKMEQKSAILAEWLREIVGLPHVGDARGRGLMAGVELVREKETKEPYPWEEKIGWKVVCRAREKGLILRPLGNVIVIMPPLAISEDNLRRMLDIIAESITEVTG